jgi:hypothetical protein
VTHWSLWAELAAQRMSQELRDAEAARRARLAEEAARGKPGKGRPGRGVVVAVWGAVRVVAYAVARAVR